MRHKGTLSGTLLMFSFRSVQGGPTFYPFLYATLNTLNYLAVFRKSDKATV